MAVVIAGKIVIPFSGRSIDLLNAVCVCVCLRFFQATLEGWIEIMKDAVDSTGVGLHDSLLKWLCNEILP